MILTVLTVAMYVAGAAVVLILLGIGLWLLAEGFRDRQRAIGYGYGAIDGHHLGDAEGYARGYARAQLDAVLATPALDDHFAEALLSGALHEPVGEQLAALLGAVQEHGRAARTEATR